MFYRQYFSFLLFFLPLNSTVQQPPFISFLAEAIKNMNQTGALIPTSRFTGKEAMSSLASYKSPRKLLEVGAGIGNITQLLVQALQPGDTLDVVELVPAYCAHLRVLFKDNPQVRIHEVDFTQFNPGYAYDYIISTLPHTSLPLDIVHAVIKQYKDLAKDGGHISYVEYVGFIKLTSLKMWGDARKDYYKKIKLMKSFQKENKKTTTIILRNLPPIYVHHVTIKKK